MIGISSITGINRSGSDILEKSSKILLVCVTLLLGHGPAWACLSCNRPLQVSVFDDNFWKNSFYMVLPLLVIGAIVARMYKLK
jgi:hypothetical protein